MVVTYTTEQLAEMLQCEAATVTERIVSGELPGVKFGRGWLVPEQALNQRLNEIALEQAALRRSQRAAKGAASTVIKSASKGRARVPPALPSHP